jgi:phage tail-like protein
MADTHGPLKTGRFKVELDDVEVSGFKRIDIPAQSTKHVEYREGKDPDHNRKLWGQSEYEDLTMERGAKKGDTKLIDWRKKVTQGKMEEARKNIAVILQDSVGESVARWEFTKAWVKRYEPPTLDSSAQGGQGNVATETVVVAYDEMMRTE